MRRSIWLKIWLSNTVVILLLTVFAITYFPRIQKEYFTESYNKETQNIASSVAWAINIALMEENYDGVKNALEYAKSWPELVFVVLCKSDLSIHDQPPDFQNVIMQYPPPDVLNIENISMETLIMKSSVINNDHLAAMVVTAFSTDYLNKKIANSKKTSVIIIILLDLASIGLSLIFARAITNPINKLKASFKKVSVNELIQVSINTKDELEDLGNAFNRMAINLYEANKKIISLNKNLEAKVLSRTEELNQNIRKLKIEIKTKQNAQRALKESERRVQKIISDAIDPIFILDEEYDIIRINQAASNLFKYKNDQVRGKNFFKILQISNNGFNYALNGSNKEIIKPNSKNDRIEVEVRDSNNRKFPAEISISKLELNNSAFYSVFIRDITMQVRIKREIENALNRERELNKMKSKFITMTSHEFRTPLTTIQSNFEILSFFLRDQSVIPEKKIFKNLSRIESELDRLTKMMNDVFTFSQFDLNKIVFEPRDICLKKLTEDTIENYYSEREDGRGVNFNVTGNSRILKLDPNHIEVILNNLLSNAFKYSENDNPTLQINYTKKAVEILVIDRGLGIPKEEAKNLFSSFYRATNVRDIKGTGLGLVIVKHFVKMNGGSINFTSKLGKGTTFTLIFPQ